MAIQDAIRHETASPAANDAPLRDHLGEVMARAERLGQRVAVLHVHLGPVDPEAGDALPRQVALRLTEALRTTDAVLPGGTDWLVVLLPGVESVGAGAIVARKILGLLAQPFEVHGRPARVEGRIGMALYPDHGFDPAALLRCARDRLSGPPGPAHL
jgi:GGDEF domain-containing protein